MGTGSLQPTASEPVKRENEGRESDERGPEEPRLWIRRKDQTLRFQVGILPELGKFCVSMDISITNAELSRLRVAAPRPPTTCPQETFRALGS